jgi:predicted pyridoxine 5'-phosphate oxidase superfamily flavin-nucleotide-binding protein
LLGIEPHTRRRNRVNGHVIRSDSAGFAVHVDQSFGNCPKYIQARKPELVARSGGAPPTAHRLDALDEPARELIARADTFFIATAHPLAASSDTPAFGVDVSHRGGKPGFVRVDGNSGLTVPDFLGNFFFNTLGNLALNPRCGLLFMDFDRGDLLYLAARGEVVAQGPELTAFAGAQRLMRFHVVSASRSTAVLPLRWSAAELSPALVDTGSWT